MSKQGRRGPPSKEQQIKNRIERMELKLKDAILKGDEKVVNNYLKYIDMLDKAATGELEGASITNVLSSAKVLIERAEKLLEAEGKAVSEKTPEQEEIITKININTATEEDLTILKGIGPAKAKRIIELRQKLGKFSNVNQLLEVKGIGPKTLDKFRKQKGYSIIVDKIR